MSLKQFWVFFLFSFPLYSSAQDTTQTYAETMFCGDARIIFISSCNKDSTQKISFVHVHENETTALEAATKVLDKLQKNCFVTWQCQQKRFVDFTLDGVQYQFDPNRIYTQAGIEATIRANKRAYSPAAASAVKQVADTFLKKYIDSNLLVVALHNNTNGGGLSINSYKKGGIYSRDAKQAFANAKQDADDFFYTTEASYFSFLKRKGLNVVLQDNANVKDDGSLSVYCAANNIPYINIEAQEGHLVQQVKMLRAVLELTGQLVEQQFLKTTTTVEKRIN